MLAIAAPVYPVWEHYKAAHRIVCEHVDKPNLFGGASYETCYGSRLLRKAADWELVGYGSHSDYRRDLTVVFERKAGGRIEVRTFYFRAVHHQKVVTRYVR